MEAGKGPSATGFGRHSVATESWKQVGGRVGTTLPGVSSWGPNQRGWRA